MPHLVAKELVEVVLIIVDPLLQQLLDISVSRKTGLLEYQEQRSSDNGNIRIL